MDNKNYLRKLVFFSGIEDEKIDVISRLMIQKKYNKGSIIFTEGEPSEGIYFVKKGRIKIYKNASDGKEHIINIMNTGDVFAEACLFSKMPYPASSEAIEDSETLMIKRKDIEELLNMHPEISVEIIKVMAERLIMVSRQIESLALKDAYGKTAALIVQLFQSQNKNLENGMEITIDLSRQEMANMVGLTRETLTRAMSKLKNDGLIDIVRNNIIILDIDSIKELII